MTEQKLPNNCLLKKTIDILDINLFQDVLKQYKISGKCFLILDKRGSIFLNNFLSISDILSKGIFSIDSIYKNRKQYKTFSAIYLISGDKNILKKVIEEDFNNKNSLYKNCHIFIIDEITDDLFDYMAKKHFIKYIKTLKQVSIKYITIDKNLFSFGEDINYNSIYSLYEDNDEINSMNISRLSNVCQALNIYPNIVYFNADKKCKYLAEKLNNELKKIFPKKIKSDVLLITSRFIDFTAPVQFNVIYHNLLLESFKNKKIKYCNEIDIDIEGENKSYILDYKDRLYNKYKDMYCYEVSNVVHEDLVEFKQSDVGKAIDDLNNELISAAQNFSKYQSYIKNLSEHINLSKKLNEKLHKRNIIELLNTQETIISKINPIGKEISDNDIISLIKNNKNKFNKEDFKRLLCLIKYNYPEIDLENIYSLLNTYVKYVSGDKKIINFFNQQRNLIDKDKLIELDNDIMAYREKSNYETKEEEDNKNDKRFVYIKECKLTTICDMLCKNKLPEKFFTFVEKPVNIKFQKKKFKTIIDNLINDKTDDENKQKLILFNMGGISNFEISSLERGEYLGQYNMNLILGSNKVYNHEEYFEEVKNYLDGKISISRTYEDDNENMEKKDSKINISDISYPNEKGSKEKIKKNEIEDDEDTFN